MQSKQNKTFEKTFILSLSLSLNLISISILYGDSDDCWLVKIVLSCKKFVRISRYLHMVYAECKYATGLSHRFISLFYFILFYSLRLFIYLLCTVLKAQIKESPRPIRICHRCGQSRLHGGPQWSTVGQGRVLLPFNNAPQHCLSLWPWNLFLMAF